MQAREGRGSRQRRNRQKHTFLHMKSHLHCMISRQTRVTLVLRMVDIHDLALAANEFRRRGWSD